MKKDDRMPSFSIGLGLSQANSQSPNPQTISVPGLKTTREKHNGNKHDGDGAQLIFSLRNTSQANHDLSIKKSTENKFKAGEKPSPKKGEVRNPTI